MLDRFTIQKLRDLPIEGVAERLGLQVKRHKCLCPFHDDSHPSLMFNTRKNTFRCYVCGTHGTTIDLVMKHLGKSFLDACHWLAHEENIVAETWKPVVKNRMEPESTVDVRHLAQLVCQPYLCDEAHRFLFQERKISQQVVKDLGLSSISSPVPMSGNLHDSWFHAPSLLIPYRDVDGNLISVQARYLGNEPNPRFQFPKGSRCTIFNLPVLKALHPGEELWITEGVTDCLAMLSSGRKAIAIPSATLLKPADVKRLVACSQELGITFHIAPDQDAPGERLFLELREYFPQIVRHQLPFGYKDFGDYWKCNHVTMLTL